MDAVTLGAASAALFADAEDARRWFQVIAKQMRELEVDVSVDDALAAIRQGAEADGIGWAAEALADYLQSEASEPVMVLRDLGDPGQEQEYVEANHAAAVTSGLAATAADAPAVEGEQAAAESEGPGDAEEFSEGAWADYLTRWRGAWDGSEESWAGFAESFLYWAPEGTKAAAQRLVDSAVASDKVEVLTPYGVVAAPEHSSAAESGPETAEGVGTAADQATSPIVEADTVLASVLQDRPDLAALGSDRLHELFAEVMAEIQLGQNVVTTS